MNTKPNLILAAVDFSTSSRAALEHAARLALHYGANLQVLHVIDKQALTSLAERRGGDFDTATAHSIEGSRKALNDWLRHSTLPPGSEVLLAVGSPLHEILEQVKSHQVDLLVAGVAGAGGNADGVGSVAGKLASKCTVDVLLVRSGHMRRFGKVLAALDFSDHASRVAASAYEMAAVDGEDSDVTLFHVWTDPGSMLPVIGPFGESGLMLSQSAVPSREDRLKEATERLRLHSNEAPAGIQVSTVVMEHRKAGDGITEHASASDIELVVIGALGHTNLRYFLLGSTAERLLSRVPCSVLVVKPPAEESSAT
jgi:nucleotide-binding universal stress UspA family protein